MAYNILVVEDYKVTRMMIKKMLEKGTDWKIFEAQDGQKALDLLNEQMPDLIILDLMMPNMNGFEFLKKIKSMDKIDKIPILILTGLKSVEDEIKGLQTGADDYLTKPIKMDILISRCQKLLDQKN
jgi:DNA-binding response OmpR family regulator